MGSSFRVGTFAAVMFLAASASAQSPVRSGSAAPTSGYDSAWYVSEFWSGEYPPGFSVTGPDTVVAARARMDKAASREVACKLPYLAVIHPWNESRIAKSKIKFLSATRIIRMVAKEAFDFETQDARPRKVHLNKGDTIEYIRNDAEGSFEVRIAGKRYTAEQNLFDHVEDVAPDQFVEEDWVLLTCEGGSRAYIFLGDLGLDSEKAGARAAGISPVGPGQTGYDKARDLTAAEARELEKERPR